MKLNHNTYKNIFSDRRKNGAISGGAPDPFIIKHNGYYYLTSTVSRGISIKKSFDLMTWENVTDDEGIVTNDVSLRHAYAPEIMYDDGKYYIVTSPNGGGHVIYWSESIMGPYTLFKDNFHESIDGSFFKDSDKKIYFTRASETGIILKKIESLKGERLFEEETLTYENAVMGGWTEGPYILKRYGWYYLTFTGTHFLSDAYRVAYLSGRKIEDRRLKYQDIILLNTDPDFKGLGHSMTIVGPDLDSYIIAYHNCDEKKRRHLCLSRLMFDNRGQMKLCGLRKEGNLKLERPFFEVFSASSNYLSSISFGGSSFTIEFNLQGAGALGLCGYKDEKDYLYFQIGTGGIYYGNAATKARLIGIPGLNPAVYHCLRLQFCRGKLALYLDGVEYLSVLPLKQIFGLIGYRNNRLNKAYLAYSEFAFGDSDYRKMTYYEDFYLYRQNDGQIVFLDIAEEGCYDLINIDETKIKLDKLIINGEAVPFTNEAYIASRVHLHRGINTLMVKQKRFVKGRVCFAKTCGPTAELDLESFLSQSDIYGDFERRREGIYFENDRNAVLFKEDQDEYELTLTLTLKGNPVCKENVIGLVASVNAYSTSNTYEGLTSLNGYMLLVNRKNAFIYRANYQKSVLLKKISFLNKEKFTLKLIKDRRTVSFYIDNVKAYAVNIDFRHHLYKGRFGIYMHHASAVVTSLTKRRIAQ